MKGFQFVKEFGYDEHGFLLDYDVMPVAVVYNRTVGAPMKIKKALKKLDKAESLLSSIIDEYDTAEEPRLKEALAAAKESVVHAKEMVNHAAAESKTARKAAGKASADASRGAQSRERRKVRVAAAAG